MEEAERLPDIMLDGQRCKRYVVAIDDLDQFKEERRLVNAAEQPAEFDNRYPPHTLLQPAGEQGALGARETGDL